MPIDDAEVDSLGPLHISNRVATWVSLAAICVAALALLFGNGWMERQDPIMTLKIQTLQDQVNEMKSNMAQRGEVDLRFKSLEESVSGLKVSIDANTEVLKRFMNERR